ncbi:acyl-CoA dehydrogenase family protein [Mycolicibacterium sp. 141076]|uniref:acyl-CoA dehydrogenase family protein n=1 Tax=Mycobacteriaceae TaxID=1762 RepID=UPI00299F09B9|nr:acyl-CoA dehydrogenase family protein [Mycolicibacterium sp. 141076]MDX1881599.1 acyl-CoA dehydrogenase family protein [Mycolicibacterium sp. 141076]
MTSPATTRTARPDSLTLDEALERARSIGQQVLAEAPDTERKSRHSEALHAQFLDAGFYHLLRPKTWGGYEFTLPDFLRVMREIAYADMATAWCLTLASGHNLQVASYWSEKAQRQLFAGDYFAAPMTSAPSGTLTRVDGGFLVDGVHRYASGVPYATHFSGHAFHDDRPGVVSNFIAPRGTYEVLDDWGGTLGLRGSGSNSVKFERAFIPEEFVLEGVSQLSIDPATQAPGRALHANPMYGAPGIGFFSLELNSLALGAALALFDEYDAQMTVRKTVNAPFVLRVDDTFFQWRYGRARAKLDASLASMDFAGALFDRTIADSVSTPYSRASDVHVALVAHESARLLWDAVSDFLFKSIGSSAVVQGTRTERIWRDLSQWWSHLNTQLADPTAAMYAAEHFAGARAES